MQSCSCIDLKIIKEKVQQQEIIIAQLVAIVAATNDKVSYLVNKEQEHQSTVS